MKVILSMMVFAFTFGVIVLTQKQDNITQKDFPFFVGTYTKGESEGIYKYILKNDGVLEKVGLAAKISNPSFLTITDDRKFLISVDESKEGMVEAFRIEGDELKSINKQSSGGEYPCFIGVNKKGFVTTANYGNGTIGLLKIDAEGKLEGPLDILQHTGSGTTSRQKGPHAHSVWFRNNGKEIVSVDLGTNEIWFSNLDAKNGKLVSQNPQKLAMSDGAGPRHMTFHPTKKWAYVLNELSSTVTFIENESSKAYQIVSSISTLPDNFDQPNSCADIHISEDGKFLYASNRGHDSIVIFQINQKDGTLSLVGHEKTRGETPRNFNLSPDNRYLLVANQKTNSIVSFKRNGDTGKLEFVSEIEAPTPVCIMF
ncbi:lactonase family protein [Flexithrix dorotheae]|uniref:lactonase family protein n=1 Tax=Flexithrix dorotheae TaxID=70993 RepID=UPI00036E288A|nr:lactonase family protein [Flexithrix dorotheae]